MSRLTDMQAEETLRRLALNISATIQQCRDVLEIESWMCRIFLERNLSRLIRMV